jgi:two-component system cell cycle sensor histidine kinase/response regulator CckA
VSTRGRTLPAVPHEAAQVHDPAGQGQPGRPMAQAGRMEVVGRFAVGIAHDFNNLLAAVLAATEQIAARPGIDAPTREDAVLIQKAARRGAALVRQLLAFARETPASPRRLDVREAVEDLAPLLRHLLGRGVRIDIDAGETPLPVRIDPTGFDQVLLNLAANARDAMAQGGVLTLRCRPVQRDGARFAGIEVCDTGSGIPPDVLPHIFSPFFTTRSEHGTGLGLATVREIVSAAGGEVAAESSPGVGTCMRVTLPIDADPAGLAGSGSAAGPPVAGVAVGRVLLVEDEPVSRRLAERALAAWGWQVVSAGSAEAALDLAFPEGAAPAGFAAVVTDMELPGCSGADLVAALRARPGGAALPAIIVSGHAEPALRRDPAVQALLAAAVPPTVLLSKPYPLPELRARMAALVARPA